MMIGYSRVQREGGGQEGGKPGMTMRVWPGAKGGGGARWGRGGLAGEGGGCSGVGSGVKGGGGGGGTGVL